MRKKTGGRDDVGVLTGTKEDGEDQEQQRVGSDINQCVTK